jgi:hypothetical protein
MFSRPPSSTLPRHLDHFPPQRGMRSAVPGYRARLPLLRLDFGRINAAKALKKEGA